MQRLAVIPVERPVVLADWDRIALLDTVTRKRDVQVEADLALTELVPKDALGLPLHHILHVLTQCERQVGATVVDRFVVLSCGLQPLEEFHDDAGGLPRD